MSQSYAVQLCRLVAPEKLADRFLSSGILSQKNSWFIGDQVLLVYIFEINKPWFPSSRVLPTLVETLQDFHPHFQPGKNLEDQFELLLRTVNERLNDLSEQGETDWIGNLNGLIMVLSQDQIQFAQTGSCPTYLLQNNRIRQITDDNGSEREPHPLKTFSNLASGRIQELDQLLIANHELYREISLDALRRIINSSTPFKSCLAIAKELKREKNPAVSSLILKVISKGEAENQTTPEPAEVILEQEMQSKIKKIKKKLMPIAGRLQRVSKNAGLAGWQAAKHTSIKIKSNVVPKAGHLLSKSVQQAEIIKNQVNKKITAKNQPVKSINLTPAVEIIPNKKSQEKARRQEIAQAAEARAEEVYIPSAEKSPEDLDSETPDQLQAPSFDLKATLKTFSKYSRSLRKWFTQPRNRKISAAVLAVAIIAGTTFSVVTKRQTKDIKPNQDRNKQIITRINDLTKKATTAVELKQEVEASREIAEAQGLFNSLQNLTEAQKTESDLLWSQLIAQSDLLSKTTRLSTPGRKYSFTGSGNAFITSLPYFFGYRSSANELMRTGQGEASITQAIINLKDSNDTIVSLAKSNESDAAGYILTKQSKVYRISQESSDTFITQLNPLAGSFAAGDCMASYVGNLYILDGKTGLLWKYSNTGSGLAKGVSIIDINKYDIKKSLSLAIDGSIYILKQDGSLLKFTSGQQDSNFSLKDQPEATKTMLQPLQVVTDENMQSIFILDAGLTSEEHSTARVIEFNKNGSFIRQYGFPDNFTKVSWFDLNPKEKKLWVLNNGEISEFDL